MDDQNAFLAFVQKIFTHDIVGAIPAQLPPVYRKRFKKHLSDNRQAQIREHSDYQGGRVGGTLIGRTWLRRSRRR
jgi:hypothetical protein